MKRERLSREQIADEAAALADEMGFAKVTLASLAERLQVKPPSLYNHVDGLGAVHRLLLLRGLQEFERRASRAAMCASGHKAWIAIGHAVRQFARERPGLYAATAQAHVPNDPEVVAAAQAALFPFEKLLISTGLVGDEAIHALRTLRSAVHGFVMLEAGGFGLATDVTQSFDWMLHTLATAILPSSP